MEKLLFGYIMLLLMRASIPLTHLSKLGFIVLTGDENYWTVETPTFETVIFRPYILNGKATKQDVHYARKKYYRVHNKQLQIPTSPGFPALDPTQQSYPLIIATEATPGVEESARNGEISLLTTSPHRLIHGKNIWEEYKPVPLTHPKKMSWTQGAILRIFILARHPLHQLELADTLGVSQPAIVKAMSSLQQKHGIDLRRHSKTRPEQLLDILHSTYPQNFTVASHWKSNQPIVKQAHLAVTAYNTQNRWALTTGEVAADHYSAWKLPETAEIYAQGPLDIEDKGFIEVSPTSATLTVRIADDHTLLATAKWWTDYNNHAETLYADPVISYLDMADSPASDSREGAQKLLNRIIEKGN